MKQNSKHLVSEAFVRCQSWLLKNDYAIGNESELCNIFFSNLAGLFLESGHPLANIRSEVKLFRIDGRRKRVAASIDFGIKSDDCGGETYDVFIEAKSWVRPVYAKGVIAPNSATSKRKQCVRDAQRISQLLQGKSCRLGALLVYEKGSTHLQRSIPKELSAAGVGFKDSWLDIPRPSLGRRKEHLGLIWIEPSDTWSATASAPGANA